MKFLYAIFVLLLSSFSLQAQELPMSFKTAGGGNCSICWWIVAEGRITPSTPSDFEKFFMEEGGDVNLVALHSSGGDMEAALRLGMLIRQRQLNTGIGRTVQDEDGNFTQERDAHCLSACIWAFLGGIGREAQAGQLSIEPDTMPELVEHVITLGLDPGLVSVSKRAHSNEIAFLDDRELDQYKIRWNPYKFTPWKIEAYKNGVVAYSKTNDEKTTALFFCDRSSTIKFQIKTSRNTEFVKSDSKWLEELHEAADSLKIFGRLFPKGAFRFEGHNTVFTMTLDIKKVEDLSFLPENMSVSVDIAPSYGLPINYLALNDEGMQRNTAIAFKNCL